MSSSQTFTRSYPAGPAPFLGRNVFSQSHQLGIKLTIICLKFRTLAANQGFTEAEYNLGIMYANGNGVPRCVDTAIRWYERAAAKGDEMAITMLLTCPAGPPE